MDRRICTSRCCYFLRWESSTRGVTSRGDIGASRASLLTWCAGTLPITAPATWQSRGGRFLQARYGRIRGPDGSTVRAPGSSPGHGPPPLSVLREQVGAFPTLVREALASDDSVYATATTLVLRKFFSHLEPDEQIDLVSAVELRLPAAWAFMANPERYDPTASRSEAAARAASTSVGYPRLQIARRRSTGPAQR